MPSLVRFVVLLLTPIDVLFDCLRTLAINSIYASEKRIRSFKLETASPETPQQPTIVAAVLVVNLAGGYLAGQFHLRAHLVLTTFTTMVLLGIVATARDPKSYATWVTTAVNGCAMFLPLGASGDWGAWVYLFLLYAVALLVCAAFFCLSRGFRRSFRYYQISSFVNWITVVALLSLALGNL